jgi:hypothetical protein
MMMKKKRVMATRERYDHRAAVLPFLSRNCSQAPSEGLLVGIVKLAQKAAKWRAATQRLPARRALGASGPNEISPLPPGRKRCES